ncbi:MAG: two component sigma54 specific Fis family transcriptional [Planctomycetota bacterium]|nr:MAG: two component sigma54 specific Fis family transcriptional [Planctomycetota bacterium]
MAPVRVLVVDDEPCILTLLRQAISQCGAEVEVADGPAALRLLGERAFEIVISDTQMPGADGIEVLKTAKRFRPGATRVLMSGNPAALARGEEGDAPADLLLNKPVHLGQLRQLVEAVAATGSRLEALAKAMRRRYADSADAVFLKDTRGWYLFMNATGAELLQRPVQEIERRPDSGIFDKGTLLEEVRASDQAVVRTRRPYLYVNAMRSTESVRSFLSVKFPVFDAIGVVKAIGCLSREVTAWISPAAADRPGRVDELVRDLNEASVIVAAGSIAAVIERGEVERSLQVSSEVADRISL